MSFFRDTTLTSHHPLACPSHLHGKCIKAVSRTANCRSHLREMKTFEESDSKAREEAMRLSARRALDTPPRPTHYWQPARHGLDSTRVCGWPPSVKTWRGMLCVGGQEFNITRFTVQRLERQRTRGPAAQKQRSGGAIAYDENQVRCAGI